MTAFHFTLPYGTQPPLPFPTELTQVVHLLPTAAGKRLPQNQQKLMSKISTKLLENNTKLMSHGSLSLKPAGSMHHRLPSNDLGFYLDRVLGGRGRGRGEENSLPRSLRAWWHQELPLVPASCWLQRAHCSLHPQSCL